MSSLTRAVLGRRAVPSFSSAMARPSFVFRQIRAETTAASPTTAATTTPGPRPKKVYPPPPRRPGEPDWTKIKDRRFLGLKRFPGMIVKPLWPFFVSAIIMIFAIDWVAKKMMDTDEWRDDPRNTRKRTKPSDH